MAAGLCSICDAEIDGAARFCSACGTEVGATVVDLDLDLDGAGAGDPSPSDAGGRTRAPAKRSIAALAVVAIAATSAWWVVGSSDGPNPSAVPAPARPAPEVTAPTDPPAPPDDEDAPSPITADRSGADATRVGTTDRIDPGLLPPLEASHVAVAGAGGLYLLDVQTGRWSQRDLQNTPSSLHGVDGGVVMAGFIGGRLAFAPVDGGTPIALGTADNELLFVGDRNVIVRRWRIAPAELLSVALDGRSQWAYGPPPGTSTIGVTSRGEVIVQAAQTIVGVDPVTGATRPIADGTALVWSGDLMVVWSCDDALSCRTEQLRLDTSERRLLADRLLRFEQLDGGEFRAWASGDASQPLAYQLVDGWLERINEAGTTPRLESAIDDSGTRITVEDSVLVFRGVDGAVLAEIASPVDDGVTRIALVPATITQ